MSDHDSIDRLLKKLRDVDEDALFEHVDAQLLIEFAEAPGSLDPEVRERVGSHVAGCSTCEGALGVLRTADAAAVLPRTTTEPGQQSGGSFLGALWESLERTVLAPAPAMAYLLLLALAYPVYRMATSTPAPTLPETESAVEVMSPAIRLFGETIFRGQESERVEPVEIEPAPGGFVLLELVTDLDLDLAPGSRFEIEVRVGERTLLSEQRAAAEISPTGVVRLRVPNDVLGKETCNVEIRSDGEPVFRQSFRLKAD